MVPGNLAARFRFVPLRGTHFFGARLRRTPKKVGDYERAYTAALSQ
jgi:hypothetical protein